MTNVAPPPGVSCAATEPPCAATTAADDREPEADAAARARPRGVDAVEALEDPRGVLLREAGPVVGEREPRLAVRGAQLDDDRRARGRVRADVREEVVDDLAQAAGVARDRRGFERDLDRTLRLDGARRVDRLRDDRREVNRLALERPPFVEPREKEKIVDEEAHPLRLARDAGHRPLEILRMRGGAAAEQLRVRAHGGERRAQLVRRVGDEAAQALVRRLYAVEHRVQRRAEPSDLGLLVGVLDAQRQVAGGDRRGGLLDRAQRPETDADDPRRKHGDRRQDSERHEQLDEEQPVQRAVDSGERLGHDVDLAGGCRLDPGSHAVRLAVVARRDREVGAFLFVPVCISLRPEAHLREQLRRRTAADDALPAYRPAANRADTLPVDPVGQRPATEATFEARRRRGCEAGVHLLHEEGAQRSVRRDVGGDEPGRSEKTDAEQEPRAQREPAHHSAASSMYPACRTVRISGGPRASSFFRR